MPPLIALLTDFGMRDAYVGMMKGVILGIMPEAWLVDLTHEIPPQDLRAGAYALWSACRYFPDGTVFCAVVDPGVGSARRAVAVRLGLPYRSAADTAHARMKAIYSFVVPDNGLLTPLLDAGEVEVVVELQNPNYRLPEVSATFHGRDIFAPAAAHLAAGTALEELGPGLNPESLLRLPWPRPERRPDGWRGEVIHADRFGNLITNLPCELVTGGDWRLRIAGVTIARVSRTFADAREGEPVAYVGSSGLLELAVRNGDAHSAWRVEIGETVLLTRAPR